MTDENFFIHPSAVVDEGAVVGAGSKIWHFCHVSSTASLGNGCSLGQNVYVGPGVQIGNDVKIQNNVSVFEGVTLEDEVFCGPSAVFTNVINPRSGVDRKTEFGKTTVHRGASIGANATILCGVEIGRYAFVGAASFVRENIPPFALVVGAPSRQIGWMSRHGTRLDFSDQQRAVCTVSGESYKLIDGSVTLG